MKHIHGFIEFIREQGVIGLAVGFILGGAITKVIAAFVTDIIDPFLGLVLGVAGNLRDAVLIIGPIKIAWGDFTVTLIDFIVLAIVVYLGIRILGLDRLDKRKQPDAPKK